MSKKGINPDKGIIVSYPRSGLNWVRYCIEALTGMRTAGRPKLVTSGPLAVYRTHNVRRSDGRQSCDCAFYDDDGKPVHNKVVLLLRDYRESFVRVAHVRKVPLDAEAIAAGRVFNFRDYFENLRGYDEFHGEKIIVRYEDLVNDFGEVTRILDFLELPYDLEDFDLEHHRRRSIEIYDDDHESLTKDRLTDFAYHRRKLSPASLEALDRFVDQNYRGLATKYLS